MQTQFYAYVLFDGRVPFYAGKGRGYRLQRHFDRNSHCKAVHERIAAAGTNLRVVRMGTPNEAQAFELEFFLITEIGRVDRGTGTLMNRTAGGQGSSGRTFKHSEETKAKIAAKFKGRKKSPETLERMRAAAKKKRYADPAERAKWDEVRSRPRKPQSAEQREASRQSMMRLHATLPRDAQGKFRRA